MLMVFYFFILSLISVMVCGHCLVLYCITVPKIKLQHCMEPVHVQYSICGLYCLHKALYPCSVLFDLAVSL